MEEPSAATNGHSECEIKTEAAAAPPTEVDPEVKQIVFEWITETLHKAWRSKEDSDKKKVIKQLMLKWHPDKNQDDPALALAATQYIQSEIERLDNGLPARTRSSYRSTFSATPTFRSTRTAYDDDDFVQQKYESMYKSFSENIRKKREEFQRQFDERDRAAKAEQQQRSREREEQWRRFEDQRKEREREAKQERDRQQQKAKERRERFDREQREREEILRAERKKRFGGQNDTENGHNSTNGDARPRESLHKNKGKSQTNEKAAPISDEEKITGMILQAGHDLKAAENDMNLDVPAHEWACFKAHQAAEKAIKALHFHRIGIKSNNHELSTLAVTIRDPELLELASKIQEIIGNNNKLYNLILSDFTVIPHEEYTVEMALEAMMCATDIIDRVKELIESS